MGRVMLGMVVEEAGATRARIVTRAVAGFGSAIVRRKIRYFALFGVFRL